MRRILYLWLPDFPLERLSRQQPGAVPADRPFVLTTSKGQAVAIHAANRAAEALGIHPGLALADARAVAPGLLSKKAEPERDRRALVKLARWCERYGPGFAADGPEGIWVDITGVAHLFGGERKLLADAVRRLKALGLTAHAGIGDGIGAASALARFVSSKSLTQRIAAPGASLAALGPLPAAALRLDEASVRLLTRLGLKRIGDLANLPRESLKRRFSSRVAAEAVLLRLDQALGAAEEPLRPLDRPTDYASRAAFPEPLIAAEGLETAIRGLTDDLGDLLAKAGRGANRIVLTLHRSDGTSASLKADLSRPSHQGAHLFGILAAKLETFDAGDGIDVVLLKATRTQKMQASQRRLASLKEEDEEAFAGLVDRLGNRLGRNLVLRLEPVASHLPERAELMQSALSPATVPQGKGPAGSLTGRLPGGPELQRPPLLFVRPEPAEVLAEVPEGPPRRLRWRRKLTRILKSEGPERIAPEWWHETGSGAPPGAPRDYYIVEDETGTRLWLFREGLGPRPDGRPPAWYVHGLFA